MSVFQFNDYRGFLRNHLAHLPRKGRGEINRMAQSIGVHPSLLSQVLGETKNLSLEQAQLATEHLLMTPLEAEYFVLLVQFERAGTEKLSLYFREKLKAIKATSLEISERVRQDRQLTEEERAIFYSHWHYATVWLMSSNESGTTLAEVMARLEIPLEKANQILGFLTETQLCLQDDSFYKMGPQSLHLPRGSIHLHKHHSNWRLRAIEHSDQISAHELMYTAPLSLSEEDFKKIRERLADVIKEVTEIAFRSPAQDAFCFNMDFFRILRKRPS